RRPRRSTLFPYTTLFRSERLRRVLAEEGVEATDDAIAMIARAADGSLRDALSLADQVISVGDGVITAELIREALGLVPEDEYLRSEEHTSELQSRGHLVC